jgi:hypothetical protein
MDALPLEGSRFDVVISVNGFQRNVFRYVVAVKG